MQMQQVRGVATNIFQGDVGTHIQYHSTVVVSFNDEEIILRSGGWRTNTTKARMNQASNQFGLGYTVFQKDHKWFVTHKGKTFDFEDGMVLDR